MSNQSVRNGVRESSHQTSEVVMNHHQPVTVIACHVLQDLLEPHLNGVPAVYLDYGEHRTPNSMQQALQAAIDAVEQPSIILLGYGLCGNGVVGLKARQHTLVIPRVDDCIALLLGSYERYRAEFARQPATYYLSKGWLECGSEPLKEYREYVGKYGREKAQWLIEQQYHNYTRLALVVATEDDRVQYADYARQVADFLGVNYEELPGSDAFARRLLARAEALDEADDDFLVIPPGGEVRQEQFFRWD